MRTNFQIETYDDKHERDRRFEELRTAGRKGLVKFSGNRRLTKKEIKELLPDPWKHAGPKAIALQLQLKRPVRSWPYISTWSVGWPIRMPD